MNPSAVTTTEAVDAVFLLIFGVAALMLVGITAAIIFFVVKYNRRRNPSPLPSPNYNIPLEAAWTILPTIIVMVLFWYGWSGYTTLRNVPADALPVKVVGRQWSWSFEYPNGRTSDRLFVPAGRPVRLDLTSADVLHNFYIPAFRVKMDAVPGMTTHLWFLAPTPGSYDAFCAEYCGLAHSAMITTVEAMTEHEFEEWYRRETAEEEAAEGERLLARHGCLGCHSLDGSQSVGPTFQGLFGRQTTVVTDGRERTLTADDDYIRRSILEPQADLVVGYPPVMPSFEGKIPQHDLEEIIEYFRMAGGGEPEEGPAGEKLAREKGCIGCHSVDGTPMVGPTWKGLFGRTATVVTAGQEHVVTADEEYLERSIREPQADLVKGYPPVMPQTPLSEAEVAALVDYIQGLR